MTLSLSRFVAPAVLVSIVLILPAAAWAQAPAKTKINPPPSADLNYAIKAKQSGLTLDGSAVVHWSTTPGQFSIATETRAMLVGKILEAKSEGKIDAHGLAPLTSTEKRFRKEPTSVTFDRQANTIRFSTSDATYPIKGGEQDRNSAVWQLAALARGAQGKFKPGSEWPMFVAGQKDGDLWTFKVTKQEKIKTPLGDLNAVHVARVVKGDNRSQQLDIWLAPTLEWYPVRIRFTEPEGDYIEQTLENITRKS